MGQYYKPVSIDKKEYVNPHFYDDGLKLMEHSYIGNSTLKAVELMLIPGGAWYKTSIVWAGDYAEKENEKYNNPSLRNENIYSIMEDVGSPHNPNINVSVEPTKAFPILVNHTKKQYLDLRQCTEKDEVHELVIHPLPLLTCEGNGRGGGDFSPEEDPRIGTRARDIISLENQNDIKRLESKKYKNVSSLLCTWKYSS